MNLSFHTATTQWAAKPHAVQFYGVEGDPETGKPYALVTRCGRAITDIKRVRFSEGTDSCGRCVRSVKKARRLAEK